MWPPRSRWKWPSFGVVFSATLSVLSAFLSLSTAYLTIFKRTDDLSIVVPGPPAIEKGPENKLKLGNPIISLINNGDRPIVVHLFWILFDQMSPYEADKHCQAKDTEVAVDVRQFLVKEKSVVPRQLIDKTISADVPQPKIEVKISKENQKNRQFPIEVCMDVQFSTPSEALIMRRISLVRDKIFSLDAGLSDSSTAAYELERPLNLYHRNGNIFQD